MQNEQSVEIDRPIAEVFDYTLKNSVKWVEIVVEDDEIVMRSELFSAERRVRIGLKEHPADVEPNGSPNAPRSTTTPPLDPGAARWM